MLFGACDCSDFNCCVLFQVKDEDMQHITTWPDVGMAAVCLGSVVLIWVALLFFMTRI